MKNIFKLKTSAKTIFIFCFVFILLVVLFQNKVAAQEKLYQEQYRPQYHFSPKINWTNDPNGLVYVKGVYHLFYQYNPFENFWGHMTWGHATSKDLIHWEHQPIAIPEEKDTMIFSGTCVYDLNNSSGLGTKQKPPMVAIYTGHVKDVNQSQHVAFSIDEGKTWTKYNKNPILDLGKKDFRDPKVFWYAPKKYWVMCVNLPQEHQVQFYASANLLNWKFLSDFGPKGDTTGVWECPDLVQIPVLNSTQKKWLLQVSMSEKMQYFMGEFNGVNFTLDSNQKTILRPNLGPDYYAGISYGQLPATHLPTTIAWANNWSYAGKIPTSPWKGAMTLPRNLWAENTNGVWRLIQRPIANLNTLRKKLAYQKIATEAKDETISLEAIGIKEDVYECDFELSSSSTEKVGISILNDKFRGVEIGYEPILKKVFINRTKTNSFSEREFADLRYFTAPLNLAIDKIKFKVFVDNSIIEVFVNDGESVFTVQAFPVHSDKNIKILTTTTPGSVKNLQIYPLQSIW